MNQTKDEFSDFDGNSWINCAMQGPMPLVAINVLKKAINLKQNPHTISDSLFYSVPDELKHALGALIKVSPEEIIIGNSASYGLHLLANGIKWEKGDEVLVVDGDFPADILPWQGLEKLGVTTQKIKPEKNPLTPNELEEVITEKIRVFCTTWINSYTGHAIDLDEMGKICYDNDVKFVVNGSQAIGCRHLDMKKTRIDAITSGGYKWLCGPYGTGFCWIEPGLLEELDYNQSYWLAMQEGYGLDNINPGTSESLGGKKYDVFGTANFFNNIPWTSAVQYLLDKGIKSIEKHDLKLSKNIVNELDRQKYKISSPFESRDLTSIVIIENKHGKTREIYEQLTRTGFYTSLRYDRIRFSPHLYNTEGEITRVIDFINKI